jgi:hypothetical protein
MLFNLDGLSRSSERPALLADKAPVETMSFITDFDTSPAVSPIQAASRFDSFFDVYGLSLKHESDLEQRTITLIARSPASPPAIALAMNLSRFQPHSIEVNIIFAQISPADALESFVQALGPICQQGPEIIIRWAKNRALLDAHERLTLGRTLCWTGDCMRRSEDARGRIDRVEDCTPAMLAEALTSFAFLWRASKSLPKTLFTRQPHLTVECGAAGTPPEPGFAVNANIVQLEDYLRIRRH